MRAGEMNHRIELKAYMTVDVDGFPTQSWSTFATVWSQKIPVSERERFEAAAVKQENIIRWKIRWRNRPVDSTGGPIDWQDCRVKDLKTDKVYDVTGIDDGGGKEYLILISEEVTG